MRADKLLLAFAMVGFVCVQATTSSAGSDGVQKFLIAEAAHSYSEVPHEVLAFYYPWYGNPQHRGHWDHWEHVDAAHHDIGSTRHYPAKGPYDSWDPEIIDWQIALAKSNGITGFISSWWGRGTIEDHALPIIVDRAARKNFKISVYWEAAPGKGQDQIDRAVRDLTYLVTNFGTNSAFLKVDGKPVIFVYGRVMGEVPMGSWPKIISAARAAAGDFLLIADGYQSGYTRLFDGLHTYNICGQVAGKSGNVLRQYAASSFADAVKLARSRNRISCLTVIPGYDDTKIRHPGLKADRADGETYRILWDEAIKAKPDWILITSWNEWHEGSEIEPSFEDGDKYVKITHQFAPEFRASAPVKSPASVEVNQEKLRRFQSFYSGRRVGVLPGASADLSYWLEMLGADVRELQWPDLVNASHFNARALPLVFYAGGEHYTGTITAPGDVIKALIRYESEGGFFVCVPSEPWPFYYDDSRGGKAFPVTAELGLPLTTLGEDAPVGASFSVDTRSLSSLPASAPFPQNGDLRWRPAVPQLMAKGDSYFTLARLKNTRGEFLGDGVVYIEHKTPPLAPGRTLYAWMRMPDALGSDAFYLSLFDFIARKNHALPQ